MMIVLVDVLCRREAILSQVLARFITQLDWVL